MSRFYDPTGNRYFSLKFLFSEDIPEDKIDYRWQLLFQALFPDGFWIRLYVYESQRSPVVDFGSRVKFTTVVFKMYKKHSRCKIIERMNFAGMLGFERAKLFTVRFKYRTLRNTTTIHVRFLTFGFTVQLYLFIYSFIYTYLFELK